MHNPDEAGRMDLFAADRIGDGVLGSYVIIGEVIDDAGVDLRVVVSNGLAPWTAKGMVATAQDILDSQMPLTLEDDYDDEDFEDL